MRTLTENQAPTYSSSGDARLDFLFHVIEGSSLERTTDLLAKSWDHSPLDTMKLIMNVRDIRHGKGIRSQFLLCLKWLYENQLETLLTNLKLFAEFGCWKDYLNLLLIMLFGELTFDCDIRYVLFYNWMNWDLIFFLLSLVPTKKNHWCPSMIESFFEPFQRTNVENLVKQKLPSTRLKGVWLPKTMKATHIVLQ